MKELQNWEILVIVVVVVVVVRLSPKLLEDRGEEQDEMRDEEQERGDDEKNAELPPFRLQSFQKASFARQTIVAQVSSVIVP